LKIKAIPTIGLQVSLGPSWRLEIIAERFDWQDLGLYLTLGPIHLMVWFAWHDEDGEPPRRRTLRFPNRNQSTSHTSGIAGDQSPLARVRRTARAAAAAKCALRIAHKRNRRDLARRKSLVRLANGASV